MSLQNLFESLESIVKMSGGEELSKTFKTQIAELHEEIKEKMSELDKTKIGSVLENLSISEKIKAFDEILSAGGSLSKIKEKWNIEKFINNINGNVDARCNCNCNCNCSDCDTSHSQNNDVHVESSKVPVWATISSNTDVSHFSKDDSEIITISLPGSTREDVKMSYDNISGVLSISASMKMEGFQLISDRDYETLIQLPKSLRSNQIFNHFQQGLLVVTVKI